MVGVIKMSTSVSSTCVRVALNSLPMMGKLPRIGTWLVVSISISWSRPPIEIVSPSFTRTVVLSRRSQITGSSSAPSHCTSATDGVISSVIVPSSATRARRSSVTPASIASSRVAGDSADPVTMR